MNRRLLFSALLFSLYTQLQAQQIMIDRGIQAEGLWCFPVFGDSLTFKYLPSRARLGLDKDSLPQFSFLRYVTEEPTVVAGGSTIGEAGGGGIVTFLVLYDTPPEQIQAAEAFLQKELNNKEVRLDAPVIFDRGRYMLVTSILLPEGKEKRDVLGVGEAPILENSRIAFSIEVDPMRSRLLLENLKMKTPDISLIFELGFSGLTDSYQAELIIDWTEVSHSQSFSAGGSAYFVSADIEMGFDELFRNSAIRLNTVGSDAHLEGLLNTVYSKLLDLLFKRVEPETVPKDSRGGLYDALAALTGPKGPLGSRKTTGFGLNVGYQLKQLSTTGQANLFFLGRSTVSRNHFIAFNIGDLYKKYGNDERIFRDVALWDPAFQKRIIHVGVDGSLEREFGRMVNNVTVKIRKKHANGEETLKEVLVNRDVFLDSAGQIKVEYLNRRDLDLDKWLEYEYQAIWQFVGGGTYTTDWTPSNSAMVNLYAPFERREISLEGDLQGVMKDCRAISVKIEYPFFSEIRKDDRTIRESDNLAEKGFEVTLPRGRDEIDYNITWYKKDGTKKNEKGKDQMGLIFIDQIP
ncbi:MAG: hypothetical protein WA004_15250 [Saprospiraceae bacterium]